MQAIITSEKYSISPLMMIYFVEYSYLQNVLFFIFQKENGINTMDIVITMVAKNLLGLSLK